MKIKFLITFLIFGLYISCTKEYVETINMDLCIGKLFKVNGTTNCWDYIYFKQKFTFFDTICQQNNFSESIIIPVSYTYLNVTPSVSIDELANQIPAELLARPCGLLSASDTTNELYYIGFTRYTCEIKEKGKNKQASCKSENGKSLYLVDEDGKISRGQNFSDQLEGSERFYYISKTNFEKKEVNDFLRKLDMKLQDIMIDK